MLRLTLSAAVGVDGWLEEAVDWGDMKVNRAKYHFGQSPAYYDDEIGALSQSNTIFRHLARKHSLYGASLKEQAYVDMILDGVEDIRRKYVSLIYAHELSDDAKAAHFTSHCDPSTANGRNDGAHFSYLENLLAQNGRQGKGFSVGESLTIADIALWEIFDLHKRLYGDQLAAAYPLLNGLFEELPAKNENIKLYLASSKRLDKVNNNGKG
jgi:glutathione S-transferase P